MTKDINWQEIYEEEFERVKHNPIYFLMEYFNKVYPENTIDISSEDLEIMDEMDKYGKAIEILRKVKPEI